MHFLLILRTGLSIGVQHIKPLPFMFSEVFSLDNEYFSLLPRRKIDLLFFPSFGFKSSAFFSNPSLFFKSPETFSSLLRDKSMFRVISFLRDAFRFRDNVLLPRRKNDFFSFIVESVSELAEFFRSVPSLLTSSGRFSKCSAIFSMEEALFFSGGRGILKSWRLLLPVKGISRWLVTVCKEPGDGVEVSGAVISLKKFNRLLSWKRLLKVSAWFVKISNSSISLSSILKIPGFFSSSFSFLLASDTSSVSVAFSWLSFQVTEDLRDKKCCSRSTEVT